MHVGAIAHPADHKTLGVSRGRVRALVAAFAAGLAFLVGPSISKAETDATFPCAAGPTQIACENALPGDPENDWEINGAGDPSIQGYATSMSVNAGQTEYFKIDTPSTAYHIDILRLGYYGGNGARKIVSDMLPTAKLPQTQPGCLTDSSNGLIDCGNWSVSAQWTVPSNAVSGLYIAHLVRDDGSAAGEDSQIPFVVRNDASHSAIVDEISDASWEAYNTYGGNSLYQCTVACPPGNPLAYKAAYAVSYNRPFTFTDDGGVASPYYAEYPMIRFLEANGYDVSYIAESDSDRNGPLLLNHKLFLSVGHDEYWSGQQRANVLAARNAGVSLAFFSGNEMFWKTRWANSEDGTNTPYRTLITYKETHFNAPTDPMDPPTWTGAWADPRFSPPADGGNPANALDGQEFYVNSGTATITVPSTYSKLRFWRNTAVASLAAGKSLQLAPDTLGYEWDVDADNGFRPPGEFDLSATTVSGLELFKDYGSTVSEDGTTTGNMTLYRAPSGALVFGAGTVQWSWGLDSENPEGNPPDAAMQQATVNLFADMGAQPQTLIAGLTPATQSTDTTPPVSTITSPSPGATVQDGSQVTITGTATDLGGGVVAGVEVSTDGGNTWHPAGITGADAASVNWSYTWTSASGAPSTTIETRATDDSGNIETPSDATTIKVSCPCSLWGNSVNPATPSSEFGSVDSGDGEAVTVGVKFTSDTFGQVSGIRFYKASTNTGTHIGSLWTSTGQLLASATFTNETASGWQTVNFSSPVTIMPNTTYVAGYFAPVGHYSVTAGYFYPSPAPTPVGGASINAPPLHAVPNATSPNGVFAYGSASTFPTGSFNASNYWVDVLFSPSPAPGPVASVTATAGKGMATLNWTAPTTGGPVSTYTVTSYVNGQAQGTTQVTGSTPPTSTTVSNLTPNTTYTFTVTASNPNGSASASPQSNAVTPTPLTPPSAPANVNASSATTSAIVTWTAPSDNGGVGLSGYQVTPYIGSQAQTPISVSDPTATSTKLTGLTNGVTYTFTVTAINSVGSSPASAPSPAVTPYDTIFDFATPTTFANEDTGAVNLGVKFTVDVAGWVEGVRFYKAAGNTGTHVGSLWDSSGDLLATATFTNESASGWQQVMFANPVVVVPGQTYVASYYAPSGDYAYAFNGFSSSVDNPPLHGVANGTSPNGLFTYANGNAFPTGSYQASNYYVDALFLPMKPPGQVTGVTASPGQGTATVSWSPPSAGTVTSYTITPYIGSSAQTPVTVSGTPPATSATVPNLNGGVSYTFTVTANNPAGSGPASAPSSPITPQPPVTPSAPGNVTAVPATGQATVSWSVPTNAGGRSISGYQITPISNGTAGTPVSVSGGSTTSYDVTGLTNSTSYTFTVSAVNSVGTGAASSPSNAVTPDDTVFDFAAPPIADAGDSSSVNLGVAFSSDVAGSVTGIRFYKATANTGTHIGSLWDSSGNLLATATFTNESTSGWQTVTFANPVEIIPHSTYIASYFAPNGHYSLGKSGFSSSVDNPPLHGLANSSTPNGVFDYAGGNAFPNGSYNASNYYVDVLFAPTPNATAPASPTNVTATPATSSAMVSWTDPTSNGGSPITGYTITPYIGTAAQTPTQVGGASSTSDDITGLTNGTAYTFTVKANNGVGSSAASAASATVTPDDTIFDFAAPLTIDSGDTSSVELGVKFTSDVNGSVTGIRFYKAPSNTGTHVGSLWDSSGNLLASATFSNETASGWQVVTFSNPVPITAGTTYVAGYFAPNGHYSSTSAAFANAGVDNPPLHAVANGTSPNGVYAYGSSTTFPNNSFNGTNYWVDVEFAP
jgi:hypothetical protein